MSQQRFNTISFRNYSPHISTLKYVDIVAYVEVEEKAYMSVTKRLFFFCHPTTLLRYLMVTIQC